MINMFERKKHSVRAKFRILKAKALIKRIIKFRKYLPSVNLSLKSLFSEAVVHRCFSLMLENTCAGRYSPPFLRTPTVAASGFSRQQILFSAESGTYCWQSHEYLYFPPSSPLLGPRPWPQISFTDPGPQFVFTSPGTKFVFISPGPKFVFTGPGPQFVSNGSTQPEFAYTDLVSPICIYWPWPLICMHTGC